MHDVILTQPQYNGTAETTEPRLQNPYYITTTAEPSLHSAFGQLKLGNIQLEDSWSNQINEHSK